MRERIGERSGTRTPGDGRRAVPFVLLVAAGALGGCVTPMMHPLRVADGLVAEAALTPIIFDGRHGGCDNSQGCTDSESGPGGGGFDFHLTGGWGAVLGDTFGVMGGLYVFAQDTLRSAVGTGLYSFFAAWGWFTVQCPWFLVGVGPELGASGFAVDVGAAVRPLGDLDWSPELGVYGRLGHPWEVVYKEFNGQPPAWEIGVRLQIGPVFAQYAYWHQTAGVSDFTIYETSVYTDTMHLISVGLSLTGDTFDAEFGF
ncbi:MAG: hypothetical protein JXB32_06570 [Deltaproteobacteria bacterium]|nr:hypothetical protein [Deltaproteobacteria bacterium]